VEKELSSRGFESPWIDIKGPDWNDLLKLGRKSFVKKGTTLIDMGDVVDELHYLHKGQVKVSVTAKSGLEKIVLYIDAPGVFGETPFFHRQPSKFDTSASEDCEIFTFKRDFIMQELVHYPEIMKYMLALFAQKIRVLSAQIEDLAFKEPVIRVANLLYLIVCKKGEKIDDKRYKVDIRITHQDIGNMTGLHRVTVSKVLKKLCNEGFITKSRSHISITNIESLEELTNDK